MSGIGLFSNHSPTDNYSPLVQRISSRIQKMYFSPPKFQSPENGIIDLKNIQANPKNCTFKETRISMVYKDELF